jgi:dihydroorotate dehydrogenase (fumarate)
MDLRTTYLGLDLAGPLIASASPLTGDVASLTALEEAGASAVVLPSLFEERIGAEPEELELPGDYAELLAAAKATLRIPVIASLNGSTAGGWLRLADQLQQAGADAIELNVYAVETDQYTSGAAVEERTLRIVHQVKTAVTIPLAVKLSPFYTSLPHVAERLADARADGLVLFNRFVQPDIDVEALTVTSGLKLSHSDEVRLALRWIAILHGRVPLSLAAGGGVHTGEDAVKLLLAGADVVTVASAALAEGPGVFETLAADLRAWLGRHDCDSVSRMRGLLSQRAVADPAAFERAQYVHALEEGVHTNRV